MIKIFEPKLDASSCRGIILKLKGDGNRYNLLEEMLNGRELRGNRYKFSRIDI